MHDETKEIISKIMQLLKLREDGEIELESLALCAVFQRKSSSDNKEGEYFFRHILISHSNLGSVSLLGLLETTKEDLIRHHNERIKPDSEDNE